jgi:hypothetical protein
MSREEETKLPKILKLTSAIGLFLAFALCAGFDFWRGYRRGGSPTDGVVFVIIGLPFTILLWCFISRRLDK